MITGYKVIINPTRKPHYPQHVTVYIIKKADLLKCFLPFTLI